MELYFLFFIFFIFYFINGRALPFFHFFYLLIVVRQTDPVSVFGTASAKKGKDVHHYYYYYFLYLLSYISML